MSTQNIRLVKYVFLDVVAYTKRSSEAQSYIIKALNDKVKGAINRYHMSSDSLIYIPTGDGMCIALVNTALPYDIHITVAKEILRRISVHNSRVERQWKRFEVKIGINQIDDIIVKDINGRDNVAGAGVNNARRIMDLADAMRILVSSTVYENLHPHKEYLRAFSNEFVKKIKHGRILRMYQFVQKDTIGLNVDTPSSFVPKAEPEPELTKLAAYYFAHSIKNEDFILSKVRENSLNHIWLKFLLWFLAKESVRLSERTPHEVYDHSIMPETGCNNIEGQLEWFRNNVPSEIAIDLCNVLVDNAVFPFASYKYLESESLGLVINSNGKEKLKRDWAEIWDEFGLDRPSG